MARQGLNCTLSYLQGKTRHTFSVRCSALAHGMEVIYQESQARVRKAFYPHRLSSAQFVLVIDLVGEAEYKAFQDWLAAYARTLLDTSLPASQFPAMAVNLPSRSFLRKGVPLQGYGSTDQVGQMVWSTTLVFETSEEPIDAKSVVQVSTVDTRSKDPQQAYFYPTTTQLNGSEAPPDQFTLQLVTAETIAGIVNSAIGAAASAVAGVARGG